MLDFPRWKVIWVWAITIVGILAYWYQRANINHVTKCISSDGCTVFLTQPGKFDFLPKKEGNKQ